MANRRMFSQRIVGDERFLEMPTSAQNLYFHLGIYADDDGFVNPQRVVRMVGANPDDIKVLIAKKFVIPFETGVVVVTNWKENNYIQRDRYTSTIYQKELKKLTCIQNVYSLDTQVRLELGKSKVRDTTAETSSAREFNFKEEREKLEESPRRDLNVIALYFEKRNPDILSYEQFKVALKRHLRPAKDLSSFSNEQILKACDTAIKEYPKVWTIETLVKLLTK